MNNATLTKGINGHTILVLEDGTRYVLKGGKNSLSLNTLSIWKQSQFNELVKNTKPKKSLILLSERVQYYMKDEHERRKACANLPLAKRNELMQNITLKSL